jgi:hypothetical protein
MDLPEHIRLLLLKILDKNGNIEPLSEIGYEYSQIVSFIKYEINDENAEYKNGELKLTQKGRELLLFLEKNKKKKGSNAWIEPEIQSKTSILEKDDVYLPNQNDLWFN